jgi:hypothetical protein
MKSSPRGLFTIFFIVDIAFIIYWVITYFHLLTPELLYKDYTNQILVDWNWSFFPIDMLISLSGLSSIRLFKNKSKEWVLFALGSLFLTMCSGLMAISFWVYHHDFDLGWWIPNLFLLVYPIFYLKKIYTILIQ